MPGPYSWQRLHRAGLLKYQRYGPIVRETMIPGVHVVWVYNPDDIAAVLNDSSPGVYPQRTSHLALQKYRHDRPHIYRSGGLLPTNGAEWWHLRAELQKGLSSPAHVRRMLAETEDITREFLESSVGRGGGEKGVLDVLPELSRLNLEREWSANYYEKRVRIILSQSLVIWPLTFVCRASLPSNDSRTREQRV